MSKKDKQFYRALFDRLSAIECEFFSLNSFVNIASVWAEEQDNEIQVVMNYIKDRLDKMNEIFMQ